MKGADSSERVCGFPLLLIIYIYVALELLEATMTTELLQRPQGNARCAGLSKCTPSEAVRACTFYPCACTCGP